jgi:hypothetical protein
VFLAGRLNCFLHVSHDFLAFLRLLLSLRIVDSDGQCWVTAFHETAEQLLGLTSQELSDILNVRIYPWASFLLCAWLCCVRHAPDAFPSLLTRWCDFIDWGPGRIRRQVLRDALSAH